MYKQIMVTTSAIRLCLSRSLLKIHDISFTDISFPCILGIYFSKERIIHMTFWKEISQVLINIFYGIYNILWGDLITIPLPGGSSLGLSLLVLILIPSGMYFTVRTRFLPFRLFPEMIRVTLEKNTFPRKTLSPDCRHSSSPPPPA